MPFFLFRSLRPVARPSPPRPLPSDPSERFERAPSDRDEGESSRAAPKMRSRARSYASSRSVSVSGPRRRRSSSPPPPPPTPPAPRSPPAPRPAPPRPPRPASPPPRLAITTFFLAPPPEAASGASRDQALAGRARDASRSRAATSMRRTTGAGTASTPAGFSTRATSAPSREMLVRERRPWWAATLCATRRWNELPSKVRAVADLSRANRDISWSTLSTVMRDAPPSRRASMSMGSTRARATASACGSLKEAPPTSAGRRALHPYPEPSRDPGGASPVASLTPSARIPPAIVAASSSHALAIVTDLARRVVRPRAGITRARRMRESVTQRSERNAGGRGPHYEGV